jgi:Family of unknown function (DUF6220)
MRPIARSIHLVVSWLFVAGLVAQVFLAGLGVFSGPTSFATHRDFGYALSLLPVVLLVAGLLGGLGRRLALLAALEFGLFILQSVFVVMRTSAPAVAALHPVNGFLILLIAIFIARESWLARAAGSAAPTGSV